MQLKITGETPFQVLSHSFSVSAAESAYTFCYSANGLDWTAWTAETPANETLVVNDIAFGQYVKLSGNTSTVDVIY